MRFIVEFDCDNAAFEEDAPAEVARILRKVAAEVLHDGLNVEDGLPVMDVNGNTVGKWKYTEEKEFAETSWRVDDITSVAPSMSDADAYEFLEDNEGVIEEAVITRGWQVIVELLGDKFESPI